MFCLLFLSVFMIVFGACLPWLVGALHAIEILFNETGLAAFSIQQANVLYVGSADVRLSVVSFLWPAGL